MNNVDEELIKKYVVQDKAASLEVMQNLIADGSFVYDGDSLVITELINAIKDGWRLANMAEVDRLVSDAFNKGFEEGLRALGGK